MSKFLSFETTNNGTVLFPMVDGCFMNLIDPKSLAITNGIITVIMSGTNMSQSLIDSINSAQVEAFQSSWRESVSIVSIPFGTTIDSILSERDGGGVGPGPAPETCDYQITVSPSAANPVNIIYYEFGGQQSMTTVGIGDTAALFGVDCFPEPSIDPSQSPPPNPANVTIVDVTP